MNPSEIIAKRDEAVPEDVARLLASVPEWLAQQESNAQYIRAASSKETWTVRDTQQQVIAVALVDRHFPQAIEIHLIVVDRAHHGLGIGSELVAAIERDALAGNVRPMQVKTLGASHPDAGYAKTRRFYEKLGFLSLEEKELWGSGTPCLIMVKPLDQVAASA